MKLASTHLKQRSAIFMLLALLYMAVPSDAHATTACFNPPECPPGQSLNSDCECEGNPLPEMSVMMLPVALGAAGLLAVRARRKAMTNKKDS